MNRCRSGPFRTNVFRMKIWDELNDGIRESTRGLADWTTKHVRDLGDAGVRHVERRDLLAERRRTVVLLGEYVANRFVLEEKKSIRADAPGMESLLQQIRRIDQRLQELHAHENREDQEGK
jgi:hypothetical protein